MIGSPGWCVDLGMNIELLVDAHATIGESPLWDPDRGMLYWVDIKAPALYRTDPASGTTERWALPAEVGAFALMEGEVALVALRTGLFALSCGDGSLEPIAPAPFDQALFRFNDGACDPVGRFWIGTMFDPVPAQRDAPRQQGPLRMWSGATGLVDRGEPSALHNGIDWSADGGTLYISHSYEHQIFAYTYDTVAGALGARRDFVRTEGDGIPDGAAIDEEGTYWCAMHGTGCLRRYGPDGTLLREIALPVSQPTMCTFGGPDLRTLFVSSAAQKLGPEQLAKEPHAGGLFKLEPGVRGAPKPYRAR